MKTVPCPRCAGKGKIPDPREIGSVMRNMRLKGKVSLKQIAGFLEFSSAYISDLELGKRAWKPELIERYREGVVALS